MHLLPKAIRRKFEARRLEREKQEDMEASRSIDISGLRTVCLALGPYRNLTTLTASMLFLHPHCQVLNHGGARILGDPQLDFLLHPGRETTDSFLRYAIQISTKGQRGKTGGSIVHSHAFDSKHKLGRLYREHFGDKLIKDEIHSLFWKESLRTSLHLRKHAIDLDRLFDTEPRLRFLLPVRNPLDSATSNLRTGHAKLFGLGKSPDITEVLDAVLEEIRWFMELQDRHPERFFHFLENDFGPDKARALAAFLQLDPNPAWVSVVQEAFDIDRHYQHPTALTEYYRTAVDRQFAPWPRLQEKLQAFAIPTT
ncbi:hypothetical protein [Thiolapillus sp.]